jgi:hypothetical protein
MKRLLVLLGSLAVFPALGQAQGRGMGMAMGSRPVAAAPMVMRSGGAPAMHAAPMVRASGSGGTRLVVRSGGVSRVRTAGSGTVRVVHRAGTTRRVHRNFQNFTTESDDFPVPGLGFDFVHFAATHPNAFKGRHGSVGGFFPFFNGGFVIPSVPTVVEDAPADDSEEVAVDDAPRRTRVIYQQQAPAASAPVEQGPVQASEEYVFVRRDGTVFFAVAYSWEGGALRYITSQGLRGTVTREALDLSATQQFNEQRGLSFHLPA